MKTKLNIGCGYNKKEGFINIDKAPEVNPDKVVDIEKGSPFSDNRFEEIYSHHCLEHIKPDKWSFVLNEIARIAKNGCILKLHLPFDNPLNNIVDHHRSFIWGSFGCLCCPVDKTGEVDRTYYSDLKLVSLIKEPHWLIKLFYYTFPYLKKDIYFEFKIVKKS